MDTTQLQFYISQTSNGDTRITYKGTTVTILINEHLIIMQHDNKDYLEYPIHSNSTMELPCDVSIRCYQNGIVDINHEDRLAKRTIPDFNHPHSRDIFYYPDFKIELDNNETISVINKSGTITVKNAGDL